MSKPIKIVITGAESTGKSTIAEKLALHFNSIWIPELARNYVEELNRKYTYDDIEIIARKQIELEQQLSLEHKHIFFDTWLIITKVWFDFVFNKHPLWLHEAILNSNIDLFLLCDIDMPWIADSVRENGGENRKKLHELYLNELIQYNFKFEIIIGQDDERFINAIDAINKHAHFH